MLAILEGVGVFRCVYNQCMLILYFHTTLQQENKFPSNLNSRQYKTFSFHVALQQQPNSVLSCVLSHNKSKFTTITWSSFLSFSSSENGRTLRYTFICSCPGMNGTSVFSLMVCTTGSGSANNGSSLRTMSWQGSGPLVLTSSSIAHDIYSFCARKYCN